MLIKILLGFPDRPGSSRDQVLAILDSAALRVLPAYPSLAGQVVNRAITPHNSGNRAYLGPAHKDKSPVCRKDCTDLCSIYKELVKADTPPHLPNGNAPWPMKKMGYVHLQVRN